MAQRISTLIAEPTQRIVIANGKAELIKILATKTRRRIIVPIPSFNEYENAPSPEKIECFPLDAPSFVLDVDAFAERTRQYEADMAVVVNPNNPTSLSMSKIDVLRLADRLAQQNCKLIVDESFIDFSADPVTCTVRQDLDQHPNLTILINMSKSYRIDGLHIGYLITTNIEFATSVQKALPI